MIDVNLIPSLTGNSLMVHNDPQFITRDADNDLRPRDNCAILYNGAWWFAVNRCHPLLLLCCLMSSDVG